MFVLCTRDVCVVYTQCLCCVHAMFVLCTRDVCVVYTQCLCCVHAMFVLFTRTHAMLMLSTLHAISENQWPLKTILIESCISVHFWQYTRRTIVRRELVRTRANSAQTSPMVLQHRQSAERSAEFGGVRSSSREFAANDSSPGILPNFYSFSRLKFLPE